MTEPQKFSSQFGITGRNYPLVNTSLRQQIFIRKGFPYVLIPSYMLGTICEVKMLVDQSCPALCDAMDCSLPDSSVHGVSPGKNTGMGSHPLLQRLFPTQRSTLGLLPCRWILYLLSHQRSPGTVYQCSV